MSDTDSELATAPPALKPCPFCGASAYMLVREERRNKTLSTGYAPYCTDCGVTGNSSSSEEWAAEQWNRRAPGWRLIETAPVTVPMEKIRVQVWSPQLGVCTGEMHRWKGMAPTVNVSNCHGDAVEHWGITHWKPLDAPPEMDAKHD